MNICEDNHYIGQSIMKPSLLGLQFRESEKHLYMINEDEYLEYNFCPRCGTKLREII